MGFLSSLFGGGGSSQPATTTQITTSKLPDEIAPKVQEIADEAKRLYDERVAEGYVPYEGATIAPYTQQELDSQAGIEGLIGTSAPLQQEALGITRQLGERFTGDTAQEYMNPYQQAVIDVEKRKAQEDFETRILPQFEKQAVGAGGMSGLGSRAGVQAALLGDAQAQRLGDIQSRGLQQAYNQAQQDFTAQKIREQQQATELSRAGPAMFASGLAEQGALAQVGEGRRGLAQEALDEAYFRFLEERNEPQAAIGQYSSTIYANPLSSMPQTTSTGTQRAAQPSTGSQLLGLGLQAANIYGMGGGSAFGGGGFSMANLFNKAEGGRINDGLSGIVYRQAAGAVGSTDRTFKDVLNDLGQTNTTASPTEEDEAVAQAAVVAEQKVNAVPVVLPRPINKIADSNFNFTGDYASDMQSLASALGGVNMETAEAKRQRLESGLARLRNEQFLSQKDRKDMLSSQRTFQSTSDAADYASILDDVSRKEGFKGSLGQNLIGGVIKSLSNPNLSIASALTQGGTTGTEAYEKAEKEMKDKLLALKKSKVLRDRAIREGQSKEDLAVYDKDVANKLALMTQEIQNEDAVASQAERYSAALLERATKISNIVKDFATVTAAQIKARTGKGKGKDLRQYLKDLKGQILQSEGYKYDAASDTFSLGGEDITGERKASILLSIADAQQQWLDTIGADPSVQDALEGYVEVTGNLQNTIDVSRAFNFARTDDTVSSAFGKVPKQDWQKVLSDVRSASDAVGRVAIIKDLLNKYKDSGVTDAEAIVFFTKVLNLPDAG